MGGVVFVARLLLAVVFGVAAVGKLLDLPGARRAVAGFGVPERAVGSVRCSRYRVAATPSVVVVAPDGRIASRTHSTRTMTEAVIRNALQSDHPVPPALRVVTVNGNH